MKFLLALISGIFLALCISTTAMATAYTSDDIMLDGSDYSNASKVGMTPVSGGHEWYVDGTSIWTAWANQWVEYEAYLVEGTWNIGLNAINHGNLGDRDWYAAFTITSNFGLNTKTLIISASDEEEFYSYFTTEILTADTYTIRYTWINDKYAPSKGYDANIEITSVFFDDLSTPEPATFLLTGIGLLAFARVSRKRVV